MTDRRPAGILEALEDQLHRSMDGPAWHGPSVRDALEGISAAEAAQHPIAGAHSCWELVRHLQGTYQLVLRRIAGNTAPLALQDDWPTLPTCTEENWQSDVTSLFAHNTRMRAAILTFPIERLFEPLVDDPPYSAFTQFAGLTQHDLYHAGQIVLLKRAMRKHDGSRSVS